MKSYIYDEKAQLVEFTDIYTNKDSFQFRFDFDLSAKGNILLSFHPFYQG